MRRFRLILVGAALLVAACGSSATSVPATNGSNQAGATNAAGSTSQAANPTTVPVADGTHEFTATLTVTGAVAKTVNFTQGLPYLPPCATLAKTGFTGATWSIPQGNSAAEMLNWNVSPYNGPGTYSDVSTYENSVELTDQASGTEYDPVDASVMSITVNADGSGSATFKNLQDTDGNAVNGSETWTCS